MRLTVPSVLACLFALPAAAAEDYVSPERCMEYAQFMDTLIADREKTPYWKRDEFKEKQAFIEEQSERHIRRCIMPYWCDAADQAKAKTNVQQMAAMNRYCAHKQ